MNGLEVATQKQVENQGIDPSHQRTRTARTRQRDEGTEDGWEEERGTDV